MNLVALEYVACQEARHGVLVLSEFAGAAPFMRSGGILFNPSSAEGLANALYKALTMGAEERDRYYERLREFVTTHTRQVYSAPPALVWVICYRRKANAAFTVFNGQKHSLKICQRKDRLSSEEYMGMSLRSGS